MHDEPKPSLSQQPDSGAPHPVVGIGASAGGIAALQQFFSRVRPDSGAAYVVILHLSPEYESRLAEVLQATTSLPVTQVRQATAIEANHVYVVPPNATLSIADAHIIPVQPMRPDQRRSPVDHFFRTLADAYGPNAVSVVLSGTGPNGSNGLKRIKERGGFALAQAPEDAEYDEMPRNALATGLVDAVLPVAEIPDRIASYHARLCTTIRNEPELTSDDTEQGVFREVLALLRTRTGHDFSNYKPSTLVRRIQRRMSVSATGSVADYAALMQQSPDEAPALMREMLISVTNFFRDAESYAVLEERVVPQLFRDKRAGDEVRVWVAGCATGEEAYSIAMLLSEFEQTSADHPRIQIFATDLDERAIAVARDGFYKDVDVEEVSEARLHRFFHRVSSGYRIRRELRELVLVAPHNLITDPPFSHIDLLTCRNVLIYLNRAIQRQLLDTFHFALRPGGFLFLGVSESADDASGLFLNVDKATHLYQSRAVAGRPMFAARDAAMSVALRSTGRAPVATAGQRLLPLELHHRLLEQYAPSSLVITHDHLIVHVSDTARSYLQMPVGEPSRDLFKLVHPDLLLDTRTALDQAFRERTNVTVRGVRLGADGPAPRTVTIHVRPVLDEGDLSQGFFLLLFEPEDAAVSPSDSLVLTSPVPRAGRELEGELGRLKTQLATTIEQYETQVEEAKAWNEELQAANEELRSSAEELETSKEELQSVNEELSTVNQELKIKIDELRGTTNDFQNFVHATGIPTIYLDRGLRVKFATTRAQDVFNVLASDVGRPLSHLTSKLTYEGILDDARQVLDRLTKIEREVRTQEQRKYLMQVQPYRTFEDRIEGVVLTFVDITTLRQAEANVIAGEERQRLLIESAVDYAIFTLSPEGHIDSWNPGAERMFGYAASEVIGHDFSMLFVEADRQAGVPAAELGRAARDGRALDERYHLRKDGSTFYASGITTQLADNVALGFAKICRDLTEQRKAADALIAARADLENRVGRRTAELEAEREQTRRLLRRLVTAQEEERARIARDLHDQLGQHLTALRIALEQGPQGDAATGRAVQLTEAINKDVDFLAFELRPAVLDDLGLAAALQRFLKTWSQQCGLEAELATSGFSRGHISPEAEVMFYRITQEAANNVVKHAHATRMDVVLDMRQGTMTLVIADDGVGFDASDRRVTEEGYGLLGMRERAALVGATLEIESAHGRGTTIYVRVQAAARE